MSAHQTHQDHCNTVPRPWEHVTPCAASVRRDVPTTSVRVEAVYQHSKDRGGAPTSARIEAAPLLSPGNIDPRKERTLALEYQFEHLETVINTALFISSSAPVSPTPTPMSTDNSSDNSTTFNFGVRIGLFILFEISLVSACAIVILLAKIAVCFPRVRFLIATKTDSDLPSARQYSTVSLRSGSRRRWRIKYALHIFLLNQLVFDLIQALGK